MAFRSFPLNSLVHRRFQSTHFKQTIWQDCKTPGFFEDSQWVVLHSIHQTSTFQGFLVSIFWRHVDFIIFQCPHSSSYQHQQKGQETMRKPSKIQLPTNFLAISWIVPGSWIQMDPVQSDLPKFSILQSSLNPWTDMMATWFLTIFVETTWCKITKMQRRVIVFGYASMPTPKFSPGLGFVILFRFSKPHFPVSHLYQTLSNAIFYWGTHGLPMPKASIHRFIMWEANTRASKNETHYILITSWCHC